VRRPLIAGMIASDGFSGSLQPPTLYALQNSFNDVVRGSNGFCQGASCAPASRDTTADRHRHAGRPRAFSIL
jgi:hypothetical protein